MQQQSTISPDVKMFKKTTVGLRQVRAICIKTALLNQSTVTHESLQPHDKVTDIEVYN